MLFLKFSNFLLFITIQIDLFILKTYYGQFTLTTKKSLHIIFKLFLSVSFKALHSSFPHCSFCTISSVIPASFLLTSSTNTTCSLFSLLSNRQHLSCGDCLEGKRGDYLTSSVLLCIIIVHIICTPI